MRRSIFFLFATFLIVFLAACGSSNTAQPAPTGAPVTITLVTVPSPAATGEITLQFTVTDNQGQPVAGADFNVIADHTDMSGMTLHGKATEQTSGVYAINANFEMSGNWKITVQVKKDSLDYKQDIEFKVE
jgi:uncharacterized GH25 family protein